MATLTRGISFRRQGSSGMSWAENWTFTDQGMFRKPDQDAAGMEHPAALGHISASISTMTATTSIDAKLSRSRSVGSVGSTAGTAMHVFSPVLESRDHNSASGDTAKNSTASAASAPSAAAFAAAIDPIPDAKASIKSSDAGSNNAKGAKRFSVLRWLKKRFGKKRVGARS